MLYSELLAIAKEWDVEAIVGASMKMSNQHLTVNKKRNLNAWNCWERNSKVEKGCYNSV